MVVVVVLLVVETVVLLVDVLVLVVAVVSVVDSVVVLLDVVVVVVDEVVTVVDDVVLGVVDGNAMTKQMKIDHCVILLLFKPFKFTHCDSCTIDHCHQQTICHTDNDTSIACFFVEDFATQIGYVEVQRRTFWFR